MTLDEYLCALASDAPTPGGGSAAALVGAAGAALVAMVARLTEKSPKFAAHHAAANIFAERADALRNELRAAGDADERAYAEVRAAYALPKDDDAQKATRNDAVQTALVKAAAAPLHICELAAKVSRLVQASLVFNNTHLESDLVCAAEFASSAANAAATNVMINNRSMRNAETVADQQQAMLEACMTCDSIVAQTRDLFISRQAPPPTQA